MAKITPAAPKMPVAPAPKPAPKPEANEAAKQEPTVKSTAELDKSLIEAAKKAGHKLTGELKLPERCFPLPGPGLHHIDVDALKDSIAVDRADGNGDDKLNADEFKKTQSGWDQFTDKDKFDRYDGDNDGYVTKEEFHNGAEPERFKDAIENRPFPILHKSEGVGGVVAQAAGSVADGVKDTAENVLDKLF
jgi:hypothetical protein